jgi:hypothetical protein
MNIEGFFVNTSSFDALYDIISEYLNSPDAPAGLHPNWGLESSYDAFLAGNPKRKIALSKPISGWIAGLESKEVVDFALLQRIGLTLEADVVVYQLSEITGECGHAIFSNGHVALSHFDDEAVDPIAQIRATIRCLGIPFDVIAFREVVQDKSGNWKIIQRKTKKD